LFAQSNSTLRFAAAAVAAASLCGCEARQLGVNFADKQAVSVDKTWVSAVKTCWPVLSHGYSTEMLKQYLADPLHLRAAFSTYSALSDSELRSIVTKPVLSAPEPDAGILSHSQTAVFTRYEAVAGVDQETVTAANTDDAAPPDALCAVHPGTPVGFK
jgi:hypothetical protein